MKHKFLFILISISIFSCKKDRDVAVIGDDVFKNKNYLKSSKDNKLKYLDSIEKKVIEIEVDSIRMDRFLKLSTEFYYLKENQKSFEITKAAYEIAKKSKDSVSMGRSLYYMGDCYENFQKDSAYYYYKESEKVFQLLGNTDRLAKVHYNKAYLLFYEGNYTESEIEVIKALSFLRNGNNLELLYMCCTLQGSNHTELEEYNKALDYFNQAAATLRQMQKLGFDENETFDYTIINTIDICNIYDKKKEYKKSVVNLKNILSDRLKTNNLRLYNIVRGNLAYSLMKSGNLEEANTYFNSVMNNAAKSSENTQSYLYKIINYGEFLLLKKDTVKANLYFNEALVLSKQLRSGNEQLKALNFLALTNPKYASFYKNEYVRISDSIVKKQRKSRDKFARIEFETSKVEDQNKVLSYKNLVLVLGIIMSVIVFLLIIYIRHRMALKKEVLLLEQKSNADKELFKLTNDFQIELVNAKQNEQNRISKELHDGIMNQIYGVRLNLGFLNEFDDLDSKEKRLVLVKELQKIESEIRTLSHDLSSENNFNSIDFTFLLQNLISSNSGIGTTTFYVAVNDNVDWSKLSSLAKINLYRILQELFLNVHKYANAKKCLLNIHSNSDKLEVVVKDDGIGFDTTKTSDGIGLKNIKERLALINASLLITSQPDKGAEFNMIIPFE